MYDVRARFRDELTGISRKVGSGGPLRELLGHEWLCIAYADEFGEAGSLDRQDVLVRDLSATDDGDAESAHDRP